MCTQKNLDEISFIRPILIALLVLYHAFAPWTDTWQHFDSFEPCSLYRWIADLAYSFMLPMFVFISGYVWAFQRENKSRKESFFYLIFRKVQRLIIPSIFFSIVYIFIFHDILNIGGIKSLVYNVLAGVGHMWFLPMLFWCFIISWFLLKVPSKVLRSCFVLLLVILSIIPLPFRICKAFEYILYFQLGYEFLIYSYRFIHKVTISKTIIVWIIFLIVFFASMYLNEYLKGIYPNNSSLFVEMIKSEIILFITISYSLLGITAMYITSLLYISKNKLPIYIIKSGQLCFGVYLIQQFVLKWIYYYTQIPSYLGSLLPWSSFAFTLIISIILSYVVRLSFIGRKLI